MSPAAHRIAILGQYKTGTTALFYQIRSALPPDVVTLFEPKGYRPTRAEAGKPVLAKVILGLYEGPELVAYEDFLPFPHKIVIMRDPRDRIVSGGLFITQQSPQIYEDPQRLAQVVELLRRKESEPRGLPWTAILSEILGLAGTRSLEEVRDELTRHHQWLFNFEARLNGHLRLKYEDFVDKRLEPLEGYLGLDLPRVARVARDHDHVVRTRQHGDWKNWFLEEDIAFFRPAVEPYLRHFGYDDDWAIAPNPVIPPEHASEYVMRTVKRRTR